MKQEDPFTYYFGKLDDKNNESIKNRQKRMRHHSTLNVGSRLINYDDSHNNSSGLNSKMSNERPPDQRYKSTDIAAKIEAELGQESSEYISSEEDDKNQPNYWGRNDRFDSLP